MAFWHKYWLVWFAVSFGAFIVPEVYALCTNARNTLSWSLWDLEQFTPGQTIAHWTAVHFLVGGVLFVTLLWLIGHFVFGIWA